jgi:hypothetical protein
MTKEVSGGELLSLLAPPSAFAVVEEGIYRSNSFTSSSYSFVTQLHLKNAIFLSPEMLPRSLRNFLEEQNISLVCMAYYSADLKHHLTPRACFINHRSATKGL